MKDERLCEGSWSTLEKALNNAFENGDIIKLFNDLGKLNFKAIISKKFSKGVLWAPRQCRDLNGKPLNTIIHVKTQKLGGGSTFNTVIVKISVKI